MGKDNLAGPIVYQQFNLGRLPEGEVRSNTYKKNGNQVLGFHKRSFEFFPYSSVEQW